MNSPSLIPPTTSDPRIVLVDGDLRAIQRLRLVLLTLHPTWEIELAGSGEEALRCMQRESADVVVCDLALPGLSGSRLLGQIAVRHPETLRVLHPSPIDTQSPSSVRFLTHYVLARPASVKQIAKLSRWIVDTRAAARACA